MRKPFLFLCLILWGTAVFGQKKLFSAIEVRPYLFSDNYGLGPKGWAGSFKEAGPYAARLDTMDLESWKHPYREKGRRGIQLNVVREFFVFAGKNRLLEWHAGVGFHHDELTSNSFHTPFPEVIDSSRVYTFEWEHFRLKQNFFDVSNTLLFRWRRENGFSLYTGLGLMVSFSAGGTIQDKYSFFRQSYDSALHRWKSFDQVELSGTKEAVRNRVYTFTVPFGMGFRLSDHLSLDLDLGYRYVRRSGFLRKTYSEGVVFGTVLRWRF